MRVEDPENKESTINVKQQNITKVWEKVSKLNIDQLSDVKIPKKTRTRTGRIQLHAYLLNKGKKIEYKIHKESLTGYEQDNEPEMNDSNKEELKIVDNVLLPEEFSLDRINGKLENIRIQETTKYQTVLCAIIHDPKTNKVELMYHKVNMQTSEATMKINAQQQNTRKRKITKLDYMEYMIEKFGSRAAIFYPEKALLSLHTTYIMKDNKSNKPQGKCDQIRDEIKRSLYDKEKKDFKYLDWECNVLKSNKKLNGLDVIKNVKNKPPFSGDVFIKNLITQIPIQMARGSNNKFKLMYNGEDDQEQYMNAVDSYNLSQEIRLGAYDGLIKSWEGDIIVVTSMGKQSTGKSYMLNHVFGTKFDISGGRCTDGAWLSAKMVNDILYVVCDFEGLGSFERSPQEDTLLATFNAAISNVTIFKCDNRFDRAVEEMFNKFQSGVKYMKGSEKCFGGELMLIIKDVVETGAKAAEEDFQRHIVRLAKESPIIENEDGEKESQFFAYQMYSGLSTIPYPPLATESFFKELNDTIEMAIDDIEIIHSGGNDFLQFIKLVMAKLHIQDWSAMSGEQAKIRLQQIKNNLQNAVEGGAIIPAPKSNMSITYNVDDDQNLLLLDGNKIINVDTKEVVQFVKKFGDVIKKYELSEKKIDENSSEILIQMIDATNDAGLNDAGLSLGKPESLQFLWKQFNAKFKRNHENGNAKQFADLYQVFLDLIYCRRKLRVSKYIIDNTKKFGEEKLKNDIQNLIDVSTSYFNNIDNKMKLCKLKCDQCYYPCLLCKNHDEYDDWKSAHDCGQLSHSCKLSCQYCKDDKVKNPPKCAGQCGHSGQHNCGDTKHTCGKICPLSNFVGCYKTCTLPPGHDKDADNKSPCKCSSDAHRCDQKCAVPGCKQTCNALHDAPKDHQHICFLQSQPQTCPYKCQVNCWNASVKDVIECGRSCIHAHDHQLKMGKHEIGHICDQTHPCPELCDEKGNCKVNVELKHEEREYETGAGSKIKYNSFAEANAERLRCCQKIPVGLFKHKGKSHKCYDVKAVKGAARIHSCTTQCDSCGYYCSKRHGHGFGAYKKQGAKHACSHGNMRNTVFYASEQTVDTGNERKYQVGDEGVAEMCNIFCQRLGRGHIHLELCAYEGKECVPEEGRRHQTKKYMPNPEISKDEVKHSKFWSRKNWEDPCVEKFQKAFDLCDFVCQHPSHAAKEKESGDIDEEKFCTSPLWHKRCKTTSGHSFKCKHPFGNAHVIFICDISGSMFKRDCGNSRATETYIKNAGELDNRLGALYSSIHNFIKIRCQKGCVDKVSAIMTPGLPHPEGTSSAVARSKNLQIQIASGDYIRFPEKGLKSIAAERVTASTNFVADYLLQYKAGGVEHYGHAFEDAQKIIRSDEETVIIFMTDGIPLFPKNNACDIARDLNKKMGGRFKLFGIMLGQERDNKYLNNICEAGGGKQLSALTGNELGTMFTSLAKQMNTGTFGKL